jgi:hypothetical protein
MPGSTNLPLAKFPSGKTADLDSKATADEFISLVNGYLAKGDYDGLSKHFFDDGYWRDHLALTWEFRTLQSPPKIADFLKSTAGSRDGFRVKKIALDTSTPSRQPALVKIDAEAKSDVIQFFFTVETAIGTGGGTARVAAADGAKWKIYTMYTALQELKGFEEPVGPRRPQGVAHGQHPGRKNWAERREAEETYQDGSEPVVVIVGKFVLLK